MENLSDSKKYYNNAFPSFSNEKVIVDYKGFILIQKTAQKTFETS